MTGGVPTTAEPPVLQPADPAQGVRRVLRVALLAAVAAGAGAYALILARPAPPVRAVPPPRIFPLTFSEPGFVDHPVRLGTSSQVAGTARTSKQVLPSGGTIWVVARCDTGTATVTIGALTSSTKCTGRPHGVVALDASGRDVTIAATVHAAQHSTWGVAVYR